MVSRLSGFFGCLGVLGVLGHAWPQTRPQFTLFIQGLGFFRVFRVFRVFGFSEGFRVLGHPLHVSRDGADVFNKRSIPQLRGSLSV